jgi:hypothetical protein
MDLNKLTAQDILNISTAAVFEQGQPALADGTCSYRTPHGLKCAVGHLIPDAAYSPWMDKGSAGGGAIKSVLFSAEARGSSGILPLRRHADLLGELQQAHDGALPAYGRVVSDGSCPHQNNRELPAGLNQAAMIGGWMLHVRKVALGAGLDPAIIDALAIPDERD